MSHSLARNGLLMIALSLLVAACGGGSGDSNASTGSTTSTTSSSSSSSSSGSNSSGSTSASGSTTASGSSSGSGTTTSGGTGSTSGSGSTTTVMAKSAKRGVAYDLMDPADFLALSPGVSWWYNWGTQPNAAAPTDFLTAYQADFYPMIWGAQYDVNAVETYLLAHTNIKYLLVMNEPNLTSQSNLTPQQAAALWPDFEAISIKTGVKIVGPQITWGTMPNYQNPVDWLDAFYAAYEAANGGRKPRIDYLGFHWYDYGLNDQLNALTKYGLPFWVTEFANWHSQNDGAQIDTLAKQEAQMTDMVATCEGRSDVLRYAWFTGRISPDPHYDSLLGAPGQLTPLGQLYLSLPF